MRSYGVGVLVCLLLLSVPARAQQTASTSQTQLAPTKDSQALAVLNQALTVAGGVPILQSISDFTATGKVTYYSAGIAADQGSVAIRGKGLGQLRIDAVLPSGTRSESIDGMTTVKFEDNVTQQLRIQSPLYPVRMFMPYLQLAPMPISSGFNVQNNGTVLVNGAPAYDIQVQRAIPLTNDPNTLVSKFLTIDYFIDVATFRVVMMQDVVLKGLPRQIHYADFRAVNGLLVPFSISETVQGQSVRQIELNQITFNSGLQDSDFQL